MNLNEDKLNSAISALRKRKFRKEILDSQKREIPEFAGLIDLAYKLSSLPIKAAPQPVMRHEYKKTMPAPRSFLYNWLFQKHTLVGASLAVILALISSTAYAALNSLPGQTLFAIKKNAEQLRVKLADSPEKKASLQTEIARKRLEDAQKVMSQPHQNPEMEIAALTELASQAKSAVEETESAAKSKTLEKNHPLIASLEEINQQQKKLLTNASSTEEVKKTVEDGLASTKQNETKVAQIKETVSVIAATSDQAITALVADPDVVTISGVISAISKERIILENNSFNLTSKTSIRDNQSKPLEFSALATGTKISISGIKENGKISATEIILLSSETAKTTSPRQPSSSPETIKKPGTSTSESLKTPIDQRNDDLQKDPSPNSVSTGFIPEDPRPQFKP